MSDLVGNPNCWFSHAQAHCLNVTGWRDVDQTLPRSEGKLKILEELFTQVKQLRPADAPVIKGRASIV